MDSALIGLVLALVALIVLDVLALRHGVDSRTPSRKDWW
jgi:hypothetical protein